MYRPPGASSAYRPPGMRHAFGGGGERPGRAPEINSEIAFPSLQQATASPKRLVKNIRNIHNKMPINVKMHKWLNV